MRSILGFGLGIALLGAAACSSSTSVAGGCSGSGAAATVSATDGLVFSPASVPITHGQSVCWQNTGSITHTVTSNDGTSFNANLTGGQTFVHAFASVNSDNSNAAAAPTFVITFAAPGSFSYHCTIHAGMTGAITVN